MPGLERRPTTRRFGFLVKFELPDGSELSESEVARQLYEVLEENGCESVYISWEARTLDRVRNRTTHGYGDKPRTTLDGERL